VKVSLFSAAFDPNRPFRPARVPVFYGWIVAAVATVGIVCSVPGQTIGVGVFTDRLIEALDIRRTWISVAYLAGTIGSGFLISPIGRWLDRAGIRFGAVVSAVGIGGALVFLSQVDRIAGFFSGFFPVGWGIGVKIVFVTVGFFLLRFFGQGLMTLACRNMIAKWFDLFRGRVTSVSGVFAAFSFSLAPLFFDWMIREAGWRSAWLFLAGFSGLFFGVFAWLFFRDNPEECGLLMDGGRRIPEGTKGNPDNEVVREFTRAEAVRTYGFWIYNLSLAFQGFFITGYTFHIVSVAESLEIPRQIALGAFLPAATVALFVSLSVGWLIDRTRLKYALNLFTIGVALIPVGLLSAPGPHAVGILIAGLALSGGAFAPIMGTVWARFFGRRHLGAISGVNMASLVFGSAFGPIAFSLSYDYWGGYRPVIQLAVVAGVVLFAGGFFADNPQRRLMAARSENRHE